MRIENGSRVPQRHGVGDGRLAFYISSLYGKFILTTTNSVADYHPFKSLYQYSDPEFGALRLTDIAGKEHPHMKAVIYNNIEENEQEYFRGELLAILRLMFGQMKQRRFIQHMISPVLLLLLPFIAAGY